MPKKTTKKPLKKSDVKLPVRKTEDEVDSDEVDEVSDEDIDLDDVDSDDIALSDEDSKEENDF